MMEFVFPNHFPEPSTLVPVGPYLQIAAVEVTAILVSQRNSG